MGAEMPPREVVARAIYDLRPFVMAETVTPLDPCLREARRFAWDEAPAFYVGECYEVADAVLAALLLPFPALVQR